MPLIAYLKKGGSPHTTTTSSNSWKQLASEIWMLFISTFEPVAGSQEFFARHCHF
jgi:hypothetical protein